MPARSGRRRPSPLRIRPTPLAPSPCSQVYLTREDQSSAIGPWGRPHLQRRPFSRNPLTLEGAGAGRVHAGPFTELRVRGRVRRHGLTATTAYRFTPAAIDAAWTVRGSRGRAHVTFPSWGGGAFVLAGLCDGRTLALHHAPVAGVCRLEVHSEGGGYIVTPTAPARVRLVDVGRQAANPNPGRASTSTSARSRPGPASG